ncbi:hypothetical protein chiPu_0022963 [Chiloscyllium punctatum]|uniref:Uncharacterized protein n=1 Tax=Chiloscyllium punctatum TaxID=137246 RepID=A0A401TA07_CHIPU|nr:hypothetical protein [Chiloscyllium punctatum]
MSNHRNSGCCVSSDDSRFNPQSPGVVQNHMVSLRQSQLPDGLKSGVEFYQPPVNRGAPTSPQKKADSHELAGSLAPLGMVVAPGTARL